MSRYFWSLFFIVLAFIASSDNIPDSLRKELLKSPVDTVRISILLQLAESEYDDEKWIVYNEEALILSEKLLDSNDPNTRLFAKRSLGDAINNKGYYANRKGNIKLALEYYHQSLKIFEELNNNEGVAYCLNNIGFVLKRQGELEQAIAYYERSVKLKKELGDTKGLSNTYNNLGNIYLSKSQPDLALPYFNLALEAASKGKHKSAIANSLNNIGLVFQQKNENEKALGYFNRAYELRAEINDTHGIVYSLINLGKIQFTIKKFAEAKKYGLDAYRMARYQDEPELISNSSELLTHIFEASGDYKNAYEFHRIYKRMADTLFNMELKKGALQTQFKYEWDKKEALMHAEKENALALEREKSSRQKVITFSIIAFLLVAVFFGVIFYNRYKIINRQKLLIEHQKTVLEKKNKDVTDSIMYAKRIQDALLKEEEYVSSHLPEHFVLFKPKDIVSGDFYWSHEKEIRTEDGRLKRVWYLAAADCTGHGVPGAMMSMLGISFLNEIASSEKLLNPAEILDSLRSKIINELSSTSHDVKDGMDISLAALLTEENKTGITLFWAGANNPLWIIRKNENQIMELKGDKQPIGFHHQALPFNHREIKLEKGDAFYIFTDGYADQFGGDNNSRGKKFLYRRKKELLVLHKKESMESQKEILAEKFEQWKGNLEQVDDVCVIGVRI